MKLDMACMVLAGGGSARFGSEKGMAPLDGKPLIAHVTERLGSQTEGPVAVNAPRNSAYGPYGDACVPDIRLGGLGPLAGVYTALHWATANGHERVVTCAVDTPFLPDDMLARFDEETGPAVASSHGCQHPVCGIWPVVLLPQLEAALDAGLRAAKEWARQCHAVDVSFERVDGKDPFFNINTVEDLELASKF